MNPITDDLRISQSLPLISPVELADELPAPEGTSEFVQQSRKTIGNILSGKDPRLMAVVGPCSVHDPEGLLDFAWQFKAGTDHLTDAIYPVLRVYFEKPRTTVGWKGLTNDPDLDGSFHVNKGLRLARQLLIDVVEIGLPAATEFLNTILGQFYTGLVSFGAIGARTAESQIHRELASSLSMPVGFKNCTSGRVDVTIDAIRSARHSHWFASLTTQGVPAILKSTGNDHCYLILRGSMDAGPNYEAEHIQAASRALADQKLPPSLIVDCSHGNSNKKPERQAEVMHSLSGQLKAGETAIRGVMLESHLVAGQQSVVNGVVETYGQSITDACMALDDTLPLLEELADVIRKG